MQPSGTRKVIISFRLEHLLGWGLTILACLVPVLMWLAIHPLGTISGFSPTMLALGRVTGLVGLVMYALNLVYSTRLRFLEFFFGGLNRVYIAHHLLGGLALILLSFHPAFLALRYVLVSFKQAALMLLPNGLLPINALFNTNLDAHAIVLEQWALFFGIIAFWGMVILLLVTFFIQLPYRFWLLTHRFLGLAFFFAGLHVLFITSDVSTHPALMAYMLIFTGAGLVAFVYKSLLGRIFIRRYRYTVDSVKVSAGNVTQMFMSPQMKRMFHKPGQFVFIRFLHAEEDGVSNEWHPFSISSGSSDSQLQISVKGLGDFTTKLTGLKAGAIAEIEGAYGRFTYTNFKNRNQIWVAGGIGITPFLSMAKSLSDEDYAIDLYYSVKTASELIDFAAFDEIAKQKAGKFRIIPFIGEEQKGFLTVDFIEKSSGAVAAREIFVCGPPFMMSAMRQQFRAKGVPNTNIHTEEFAMS